MRKQKLLNISKSVSVGEWSFPLTTYEEAFTIHKAKDRFVCGMCKNVREKGNYYVKKWGQRICSWCFDKIIKSNEEGLDDLKKVLNYHKKYFKRNRDKLEQESSVAQL